MELTLPPERATVKEVQKLADTQADILDIGEPTPAFLVQSRSIWKKKKRKNKPNPTTKTNKKNQTNL